MSFRSFCIVLVAASLGFVVAGSIRAESDSAQQDGHSPSAHGAQAEHGAQGDHAAASDHGGQAGHHGDVDYDQPPINPDRRMLELFLFSIVLFGAFVYGARKWIWAPLIQELDAREARVNQAHVHAQQAQAEAERLLEEHDAKMAEVREQVREIIGKARAEAEQEKAKIITEAEEQARQMKESAIADIHSAREQALQQLMDSIDQYVDLATEHVVGQKL